jgi:hypothetical protein
MTTALDEIGRDGLAVSVGRATAAANAFAMAQGIDPATMQLEITEEEDDPSTWVVTYHIRNPIRQRGGGMRVWVSRDTGTVTRSIKYQ